MPRVQYSLGSLFELTLALSAYLAAIAVLVHGPGSMSPRIATTLCVSWAILLVVYLRRRYVAMVVIHAFCAVLMLPSLVGALDLAFSSDEALRDGFRDHFHAFAMACLSGTFLSFPVFVVRFFRLGSRMRSETPVSDQGPARDPEGE